MLRLQASGRSFERDRITHASVPPLLYSSLLVHLLYTPPCHVSSLVVLNRAHRSCKFRPVTHFFPSLPVPALCPPHIRSHLSYASLRRQLPCDPASASPFAQALSLRLFRPQLALPEFTNPYSTKACTAASDDALILSSVGVQGCAFYCVLLPLTCRDVRAALLLLASVTLAIVVPSVAAREAHRLATRLDADRLWPTAATKTQRANGRPTSRRRRPLLDLLGWS